MSLFLFYRTKHNYKTIVCHGTLSVSRHTQCVMSHSVCHGTLSVSWHTQCVTAHSVCHGTLNVSWHTLCVTAQCVTAHSVCHGTLSVSWHTQFVTTHSVCHGTLSVPWRVCVGQVYSLIFGAFLVAQEKSAQKDTHHYSESCRLCHKKRQLFGFLQLNDLQTPSLAEFQYCSSKSIIK